MRRMMLVVALVLGCGSDSITNGEACDIVGGAFCRRAADCGLVAFDACFQEMKLGCCLNEGTCGQKATDVKDPAKLETECEPAILASSCGAIQQGVLPAICLMNAK